MSRDTARGQFRFGVANQRTERVSRVERSVLRAPVARSGRICSDTLIAGEVLTAGRRLSEPTRAYSALMREDGNFVAYRVDDSMQTWASGTEGHAEASVVMHDDGELAIYGLDGQRLWRSPTGGNPGAFVQLHEGGQLVIYGFYRDLLWSSNDTA